MKTIKSKTIIKYVFKSKEDFEDWIEKHAEKSVDVSAFVIGFYKQFVPDWDNIIKVHGFPSISKNMTDYVYSIISKYFDNEPSLMWLQHGFGINATIGDNEILIDSSILEYKEVR